MYLCSVFRPRYIYIYIIIYIYDIIYIYITVVKYHCCVLNCFDLRNCFELLICWCLDTDITTEITEIHANIGKFLAQQVNQCSLFERVSLKAKIDREVVGLRPLPSPAVALFWCQISAPKWIESWDMTPHRSHHLTQNAGWVKPNAINTRCHCSILVSTLGCIWKLDQTGIFGGSYPFSWHFYLRILPDPSWPPKPLGRSAPPPLGIDGVQWGVQTSSGWWARATPLKNMSSYGMMKATPILMGKYKMATKPPTSHLPSGKVPENIRKLWKITIFPKAKSC